MGRIAADRPPRLASALERVYRDAAQTSFNQGDI